MIGSGVEGKHRWFGAKEPRWRKIKNKLQNAKREKKPAGNRCSQGL
jgi:hypothetical protein